MPFFQSIRDNLIVIAKAKLLLDLLPDRCDFHNVFLVKGLGIDLIELVRTNDLVIISFTESLLKDQGINCLVLDQHMSMLEGSIGILQRRIMVHEDEYAKASRILHDAGLQSQLKT